jgi:hypothetical protein
MVDGHSGGDSDPRQKAGAGRQRRRGSRECTPVRDQTNIEWKWKAKPPAIEPG